MLMSAWGITFYLVQFSVVSNPQSIDSMKETIFFNLVSFVTFCAPIFFFCSGFLQTLSLMDDEKWTKGKMAKYYFKKFFRYMPLNIVALLTLVYMLPYVGNGPVWNHFATLVAPCNTHWWTNVLWISNLYPREFSDKCLPWTWFGACYVQLSLLLPLLLLVYRSLESKVASGFIFAVLGALAMVGNFLMAYNMDIGASPVANDAFFAKIYMSPVFQFVPFLIGMCSSLIYQRYIKEKQ